MVTSDGRWKRLPTSDRLWLGEMGFACFGPITMPSRDDLVRSVRRLADYPGATRLGLELDHVGGRVRRVADLDAWSEDSVHVLENADALPVHDIILRVADASAGGPPLSFWVAGDRMCFAADHGLGDGHFLGTAAAIIEGANTGTIPDWVRRPAYAHPLRSALWSHFGRHPQNAVNLARYVRAQRRMPTAPDPSGSARSAWTPNPTVRTRASDATALRDLKTWRDRHASAASSASLVIAAAEVALRELAVPTTGPPLVLFSLRRYLADRGADVAGNFSFGVRVPEATTGDAQRIHSGIVSAMDLGRPLAALGLAALRRGAPTAHRSSSTAWDVAHSYLGRPRDLERLEWHPSESPPYGALAAPGAPNGVTIVYSEVQGRLGASVSFDRSVVDAALVERFLDLLCGDPAAMLEQRRTR